MITTFRHWTALLLRATILVPTSYFIGCTVLDHYRFDSLKAQITSDLTVGLSAEDLHIFLKKYNFQFSFYEGRHEFHGIIRNPVPCVFRDTAFEIDIKLDEMQKLTSFEFYETLTFL